ncbi:UDP-4-amino-4,6-dideoxy-N-acetyl-beta-L-altrosamine transaminase [Brevundimonas sp. SL130]|uniref:UDP-4-amino-4, 6-dideoxy-N-acetyl-beta-L-altrosamine transaminase n=1 Tax=Brevundimonas sp. SL130 TaxID=2995143 RepID=UPI00226CA3F3|nr:UDP-4-amino-4,6-dideoxy-N-acetyl-beta-L-altrosamine transaminase [Brevundimonas sp. SL130]WAC60883.1 UDP-4-amino-4,6-dideoxy-N-acetyl-beta-L-altrosamine transaminase [Brevundimonas sp. SL130]
MEPKGFIPYGRQWIDADDERAVLAALRSDFLTQGPATPQFEAELAAYVGARFAVAVSNATAGLHLTMAALDLSPGEGITSPITFVATANAMAYVGLTPVFADIDAETLNLSPAATRAAMTDRTRVIAPVHFAGRPADMAAFREIADEAGARIVEDAAHAIGSEHGDGKVGDCRHSDATVFSFHPVKTMTTGEGGAVTTNDPALYERLLLLRSHGITRDPARLSEQPGTWWYEQQLLGFNYRLTEIQAALGSSQLRKLDRFIDRRLAIVDQYQAAFEELDWLRPPRRELNRTGYHLFVVQIDFERIGRSRAEVMADLAALGVGSQVHYIPVPHQPWYRQTYGEPARLPAADRYYETALSLPLFPAMTDEEVERVISAVKGLASGGMA